jgi:hypothetical protein
MRRHRAPVEEYLRLTVSEILVDLPRLDAHQLHLVRSLEEDGPKRAEVLEPIDQLLSTATAVAAGAPTQELLAGSTVLMNIRPRRRRRPRVRRAATAMLAVLMVGVVVKGAAVRLGHDLATPASAEGIRPSVRRPPPARSGSTQPTPARAGSPAQAGATPAS